MDTRLSDNGVPVSILTLSYAEPAEYLHCECGALYKLEYIRQVKKFRCPACRALLDPHDLSVVETGTPPETNRGGRDEL